MTEAPSRRLSAGQIGELVRELAPLVAGLEVKAVQALPPRDLLLVLQREDAERVRRLRVSADPDAARVHLQLGRVERASGPPGPFFRRLEEELRGARLVSLEQVRGDRICLLEFRETPSGQRRALLAELTSRHANLCLLGPGDRLLELLVPAPARGGEPRLALGAEWRPPPGRPGPAAEAAPLARALPDPPERPAREGEEAAPLSWRVECALGAATAERDEAAARSTLVKRAKRKLSRARSLLAGLERRLAACEGADEARREGELLAAHQHELQRGMESVELEDWYEEGAPKRRIALDPRRTPAENVEARFERYRKLERARAGIPAELERARERVAALKALLDHAADESRDPTALDAEAVERGLLDPQQVADPRKRKPPPPRRPYRSFTAQSGAEIRVGRSARDNDALTFRHANGRDLWLHTADAPGSHVVLRVAGRSEPEREDVLDAAHLAVHFSPLRSAGRADVHVAERKLVHKPRGAKPGLVTLSGGKVLHLRLEPGRLARLLKGREREGESP